MYNETLKQAIANLNNAVEKPYKTVFNAIDTARKTTFSEFKEPEVKRSEMVKKQYLQLLEVFKGQIKHAALLRGNSRGQVLDATNPPAPVSEIADLKTTFIQREVRDYLKAKKPKDRNVEIEARTLSGDLSFLHAIVSNPVGDIMSEKTIGELRRAYVQKFQPKLLEREAEVNEIYDAVRSECGKINSTVIQRLMDSDISNPVTEIERSSVFVPEGRDVELSQKRILTEQRALERKERNKKLEESQTLSLSLSKAHELS